MGAFAGVSKGTHMEDCEVDENEALFGEHFDRTWFLLLIPLIYSFFSLSPDSLIWFK